MLQLPYLLPSWALGAVRSPPLGYPNVVLLKKGYCDLLPVSRLQLGSGVMIAFFFSITTGGGALQRPPQDSPQLLEPSKATGKVIAAPVIKSSDTILEIASLPWPHTPQALIVAQTFPESLRTTVISVCIEGEGWHQRSCNHTGTGGKGLFRPTGGCASLPECVGSQQTSPTLEMRQVRIVI